MRILFLSWNLVSLLSINTTKLAKALIGGRFGCISSPELKSMSKVSNSIKKLLILQISEATDTALDIFIARCCCPDTWHMLQYLPGLPLQTTAFGCSHGLHHYVLSAMANGLQYHIHACVQINHFLIIIGFCFLALVTFVVENLSLL